ncbi:hypothetical protein HK097_003893 [Rhizophlyctis rosea]|uniref:Uncharacterized protein n=1 Tax=Rhizophlyctis rosea TaxID=64517 RepID=A0AAD5S217_9FUNG|nr:hypothetical protein HK097_003893 [Rhizophlyctis rosea]
MSTEIIKTIRNRNRNKEVHKKDSNRNSEATQANKHIFPYSFDIPALDQYLENLRQPNGQPYKLATVKTWAKTTSAYERGIDEEVVELFRAHFPQNKDLLHQITYDAVLNMPKEVAAKHVKELARPLYEWRVGLYQKVKDAADRNDLVKKRQENWIHFRTLEKAFNNRFFYLETIVKKDEKPSNEQMDELEFWTWVGLQFFSEMMLRADVVDVVYDRPEADISYKDGYITVKDSNKTGNTFHYKVRPDVAVLVDGVHKHQQHWIKMIFPTEPNQSLLHPYSTSDRFRLRIIGGGFMKHFGKYPDVHTQRSIKNTYMYQKWKLEEEDPSTQVEYVAKPFDHSLEEALRTYVFTELFDPDFKL